MNNLSSYCGLVDVRINASDKDLPVPFQGMEALLLKHSNICVLLWHFVLALKPSKRFHKSKRYRCHDYVLPFWLLPVLSLKGDKLLSFTDTQPYLLEMSSSWNFLTRAEL